MFAAKTGLKKSPAAETGESSPNSGQIGRLCEASGCSALSNGQRQFVAKRLAPHYSAVEPVSSVPFFSQSGSPNARRGGPPKGCKRALVKQTFWMPGNEFVQALEVGEGNEVLRQGNGKTQRPQAP